MRLRTRLFAGSSVQLLAFGALLAYGYAELQREVIPMLDAHLSSKLEHSATLLASQLEVALGAGDPARIDDVIDRFSDDPDLKYVEVRDVRGVIVASRGARVAAPQLGPPHTNLRIAGTLRAWERVRFESVELGTVAVVVDTGRADRVRSWTATTALLAGFVWLCALVHAWWSARRFAQPIRAMKEFSRRVAAGELGGELAVSASGELAELRDHLNAMTHELHARELARRVQQEQA